MIFVLYSIFIGATGWLAKEFAAKKGVNVCLAHIVGVGVFGLLFLYLGLGGPTPNLTNKFFIGLFASVVAYLLLSKTCKTTNQS